MWLYFLRPVPFQIVIAHEIAHTAHDVLDAFSSFDVNGMSGSALGERSRRDASRPLVPELRVSQSLSALFLLSAPNTLWLVCNPLHGRGFIVPRSFQGRC